MQALNRLLPPGAIVVAFVSPDSFTVNLSIFLLVGVVVGGLASIPGAIFGGIFIQFVPNIADEISKSAPAAIYGVMLIGFALLGLYWILPARRWRGLALGLGVGCWMGFYQVARGEHFLSHTLATAALAWLLCAGLALVLRDPLDREVSSSS